MNIELSDHDISDLTDLVEAEMDRLEQYIEADSAMMMYREDLRGWYRLRKILNPDSTLLDEIGPL